MANWAKRLGIDTNDKSLADQQPTDADLALLRALTMEGRELSRSLTALEKQLSEETQYLNELERNQRPGSSIDPKFFTERLVAIQPTLAEIDKIDLLTVKLARTTADLSEATARLVPSVDDLDAVLAAPLPDLNALTELRKLEDEAATGVRDATSRLSSVRGERQNIIREIDGLEERRTWLRGATSSIREVQGKFSGTNTGTLQLRPRALQCKLQ